MNKRVVITGLGAITPIGLNAAEFWQGLEQGKCGISEVKLFDTTLFPVKIGGEIKNFDPGQYMPLKRADRNSRATQFAIAATRMAIEDAKLAITPENKPRIGIVIATTGMPSIATQYGEMLKTRPLRIDPLITNRIDGAMVPIQVGLEIGVQGPNTSINSACASGGDALGTAMAHILMGNADVMLAGGAESQICPLSFASMSLIGALSRAADPARACLPFDTNRSGMVLGEGAAMLVLESYEHALGRNAPILAELAGVGWSFDAYNDTAPNADTQAVAMRAAIKNAGLTPDDIDYINAHGTSTRLNDVTETQSLKLTFGQRAYRIPVSSNKSMIGHLAAAAGAAEAAATVLTILHGVIPPTIGLHDPDPECDLDYVPNTSRRQKVTACLSNSFGLGGQNTCVVIKAV